jgi:hypothetical protein
LDFFLPTLSQSNLRCIKPHRPLLTAADPRL